MTGPCAILQPLGTSLGGGRVNLVILLIGLLLLGAGWSGLTDGMGKQDRRGATETNISSLLALLAGIAILAWCVYEWIPFAPRP